MKHKKPQVKRRLRELLPKVAAQLDPAFQVDPAFNRHPHLTVVRRKTLAGKWQFIALSFSPKANRFFLEAAYSPNESYPLECLPFGYDLPPSEGKLRFRASNLWRKPDQSGGWRIVESGEDPLSDMILKPEGVFDTPEAALEDVRRRLVGWVLPHLDKVTMAELG